MLPLILTSVRLSRAGLPSRGHDFLVFSALLDTSHQKRKSVPNLQNYHVYGEHFCYRLRRSTRRN